MSTGLVGGVLFEISVESSNNPSCRLDVNGFGKFGNQSQYIRIGKLGSNLHIDSYDGQLNINRNTNNETYFGGEAK